MSYSSLLKKHGLKIWLSNFLGNVATSIVIGVITFILVFGGLILIGATAGPLLMGLDQNMTEEEMFRVIDQSLLAPGIALSILILFVLFFILILLPTAFQTAGSIAVAVEAAAFNRSDVGTFFSKGFKYTGKMFLFFLLSSLLYLAVFVVGGIAFPFFATDNGGGIILGVLLTLAAIVLAVLLGLALMHAPVILIAEHTKVTQAISKSFYLFKKAFGRVFGSAFYAFLITAGLFVIYFIVLLIFGSVFAGFSAAGTGGEEAAAIFSLIGNLVGMALSWVVGPVFTTITSLLIIHRYFKYLRHWINPHVPGGESAPGGNHPNTDFKPSFSIKTDAEPSQHSNRSDSDETFNWDTDGPEKNQ
ncbi:hypothetical protein [Lihuaxuella thermophila]|uniref:Membrane domain of glycerophosphoryl diester phosphodiesterase n=1 Tax=Lihuaxuella thermophila TaxID=1173111 RepID=A0A1H8CZZ7_9BACL|nr:hypothetical protein [Lihuaxuella thermophila]SEM99807.1 hypothetical protein SAMN05444955_104177 [Lihuaxuella thermophila]